MITRGGQRLQRWYHVISSMYPSYVHDIPNLDQVTISNLHKGGAVNSDTCNGARKTHQLLVKSFEDEAALLSVDETMILEDRLLELSAQCMAGWNDKGTF